MAHAMFISKNNGVNVWEMINRYKNQMQKDNVCKSVEFIATFFPSDKHSDCQPFTTNHVLL